MRARMALRIALGLGLMVLIIAVLSGIRFMPAQGEQGLLILARPVNVGAHNWIIAGKEKAVEMPPVNPAESSAFDAAAAQNPKHRTELQWAFGGKAQRGWYLYTALIQRLINTDQASDSAGFAQALSRWQQTAGIAPTGILDNDTLSKMVTTWQSQRFIDSSIPSPDQLMRIPDADLYDPSRPEELRKVEQQTYSAYKRMIRAAAEEKGLSLKTSGAGELAASEKFLKIVSAFRTPEYQEQLRQRSPDAGRAGLAKKSVHFTGRALDVYVGGDPVSTEDGNRAIQVQTAVYQWLVKNADKFGFRPYFYEPWHWEYRPD